MSSRQRLIYAAVMTFVIFFLGEFVFGAGTLLINIVFAVGMGVFAYIAVTVAGRISGRNKR